MTPFVELTNHGQKRRIYQILNSREFGFYQIVGREITKDIKQDIQNSEWDYQTRFRVMCRILIQLVLNKEKFGQARYDKMNALLGKEDE